MAKLTGKQMRQARKALKYANEGTPIKDAFDSGNDEHDLFVALLEYAVERKGA